MNQNIFARLSGVKRVIAALIAGAILSLGNQASAQESVISQVVERGTLKVGISKFVPWAMESFVGDLVGYEVDVATRLAEDLGVKLEVVPTNWEQLIPSLLEGKIDLIISGMSITPVRALKINFTAPYGATGYEMAANSNVLNIKQLSELNNSNITLALRTGTISAQKAIKNWPNARKITFDNEQKLIKALLDGKVHAWISGLPAASLLVADHPNTLYQVNLPELGSSAESIGLRKGDVDSLAFLNSWIVSLENNGWLYERRIYWFTGKPWRNLVKN